MIISDLRQNLDAGVKYNSDVINTLPDYFLNLERSLERHERQKWI